MAQPTITTTQKLMEEVVVQALVDMVATGLMAQDLLARLVLALAEVARIETHHPEVVVTVCLLLSGRVNNGTLCKT